MTRNPALSKLEAKLTEIPAWRLSGNLFGDVGADINDFEPFNYTYFLDNVRSLQDLLKGLEELRPFADDALDVAKSMTERDFRDFKLALVHERKRGKNHMPERFFRLLMPDKFIIGQPIAEEAKAPLGAALIRIMEMETEET